MKIEFTAHNIRLDDGTLTKPDERWEMGTDPRLVSAMRVLDTVFPGDKSGIRVADLGCLEGGYAIEFGRRGFQVVGIDVRESNIASCEYVKEHVNLPNVRFVRDDVWSTGKYGPFDAIFCCGLLYHLDRPKEFLALLATHTSKLLILQTHFALNEASYTPSAASSLLRRITPQPVKTMLRSILGTTRVKQMPGATVRHSLSEIAENESLPGRWYTEFDPQTDYSKRQMLKWASWDNHRSFWIQREYLLDTLYEVGFDLVAEQFDTLGPNIAEEMISGFYKAQDRGTFIGVKTGEKKQ